MGTPLIPDEFPFTADEVLAATRRWRPEDVAEDVAEAFVDSATFHREWCEERSEELGRAGHEPPERSRAAR
ncbi:MAG TPA: hypothetical protein VFK04_02140 [Gemmatimonadaceae bacterium]|nr:hypothetical protein [Gemmatimonadaceae bacterium]